MVVILEGSPISTEDLCISVSVTIGLLVTLLVTSLTKILLPRWLSLAGRLGGSKLYFRMMEATVFLGTFNAAEMFWYPFPDLCFDTILYQSSTDNSFDFLDWFSL